MTATTTTLALILMATTTSVLSYEVPLLPPLPQNCGFIFDDPHVVSFDRLVYECQAEGDYILSKSLDSGLELQARYYKGESWGWTRTGGGGTTAIGAVLRTGVEGEPLVEAQYTNPETCELKYYIDGVEYDLEGMADEADFAATVGNDKAQFFIRGRNRYFVFEESGISFRLAMNQHREFGCFFNVKLCLPDELIETERIVGQLGSPDGNPLNDFMNRDGTSYEALQPATHSYPEGYWSDVHDYCTTVWCVSGEEDSLFQVPTTLDHCNAPPYQGVVEAAIQRTSEEVKDLCGDDIPCLVDGTAGGLDAAENTLQDERDLEGEEKIPELEHKATSYGDPHFKTWNGDKFDYHGECDLVLVDNPSFNHGMGLKIYIRTTRVQYYSYIERIAIKIGHYVLEFANDVDNFLVNGRKVPAQRKHHKDFFSGFLLRRDKKAISIRLSDQKSGGPKIDLIKRSTGFPAVVVDAGDSNVFKGSLGLLGEWSTGRKLARDGQTEMQDQDATKFALEWQVRDTEPRLFEDARFPQFPTQCVPPKKVMGGRLGMSRAKKEAEKACAHWKDDKEECIFDVMASRNPLVAKEGQVE